jgi:hypothetical protein
MARSSISIELENKYPATPESSSQARLKSRMLILSYSPLEIKDLSAGFFTFLSPPLQSGGTAGNAF